MNKRIILLVVVSWLGLSRSVSAGPVSPYGPEARRFGAGLYLGEPTGLTFKGYVSDRMALDGLASWSFVDKAFTLIGDMTYDFFDIPVHDNRLTLPFYAGIGGKLGIRSDPGDRTVGGIRIPVGLALQLVQYPIEVFFELAPGIDVAPATEFDLTGGLGARFYF